MVNQPDNCAEIERVNILGVGVSAIRIPETLEFIACCIARHQPTYIVVASVHTIVSAYRRVAFRSLVNRAGLVTPDGMPLVLLCRRWGYPGTERVYGPDLMLAVCEQAARSGDRHFFYGGQPGVPEEVARRLQERFPGLPVAGTYSPPYRDLTPEEEEAVTSMINDAQPDVVWVALGSPRQEAWIAAHRDRLDAPVLIGVGYAFDIHSGRLPQAPRWMQRAALEWLFRLWIEPRRLWKRYLVNNPLFVILVILQILKRRLACSE
ncbi:MAG: WecB/TagA/CpsF family glycosyltransferase [Anaerolineae bacterium]|nr:WecB/TagA/CpsF family glycosyltransferase [Anaerolineae bacterium]